ncbi:SDR family oxidoreductase [Bdellovibrio sp. 22V]|uniref:SDR family oxidoreductase n=1 Tax=Bdellovibrio TaxID=958 RepID=UPI00254387CA|nr:SDR family oxidoreductase [Bdellovibrio sp. 22V]WII72856.1 SDR family oxidoreductase [Bdellovibrio sp. 22V]
MKPRILVTGGTGFLGKHVVPLLREKFEVDVLSRSGKTEVQGDLSAWNGDLDLASLKNKNYALLLHMAGLYDLKANKVDCNQHNIAAMGTALKIAGLLNIPFFVNTSTVAAAVNSSLPTVKPFDLNFSKPFPDAYSESKAMGEQVLQNWPQDTVSGRVNLRLGILVGDTKKGTIERVDGIYHAAEGFAKIRTLIQALPTALPLPGHEKVRMPIVPVDKAAEAIVKFCEWTLQTKPQGYHSFHVSPTRGLSAKELYESTLKRLAIPHNGIALIGAISDTVVMKASKYLVQFPEEEIYYLLNLPRYETTATKEILGDNWCPEFKDYELTFWSGYEAFLSNRRN